MARKFKAHQRGGRRPRSAAATPSEPAPAELRIIGGTHRGRKLAYSGDLQTRPMKDRVREAVFNLLGPAIRGTHVIDVFAGTGAIGLEALSRGAARATFVERHFPTADVLRQNAQTLALDARCQIIPGDAFAWSKQVQREGRISWADDSPPAGDDTQPWLVFISPPWDLFTERADEMVEMVTWLTTLAPAGSFIVVEADERFDLQRLPRPEQWQIRAYPPAVIAILRT